MSGQGKVNIVKSVCRICHGGCGALLHVRDGRLIRVKPDPSSLFSRGRMCIKGLSTPDMMYHPDRLLTPLKRDGRRGSGKWKEIDWDTALDEIAGRIDAIRRTDGPEAVAIGQGTGRHHFMHVIRFANSLGTPNWFEPGLANCLLPRITASFLTCGGYVNADYYGNVPPRTILFWGHNPIVSGPDGELSFQAEKALKDGAFGIAIDPRHSETAKRCGLWLPVRPGADDALALAMIHVIIFENLYDKDFVEKWTVGFNRLKAHVKKFTPQWAEEITWVAAEDIAAAARRYALNKPSVLEWGVAVEHTPNALQTVRALAILRGLTGNIDAPGADILGMNILKPYPVLREKLPRGMAKKRIGADQFKLLGGFRSYIPSAHIPGVLDAIRFGRPYPIRGLLIFGSNPLVTVADARAVHDALVKVDFLTVTDMFMTPTAALADYVLPATFWPETDQLIELPFVSENAVLAQQKAVSTDNCRQDEEIMIDLARRLNLPDAEKNLTDILNFRLEPLGITFDQLKDHGMVYPVHEYKKFEENGFRTPSKKVELYSKTLERMGYDPMPVYREPPESPYQQPDVAKTYPYVLTTGSRRKEFFHSEHWQIPKLRKKRPHPLAEMHPDIAVENNIRDGDWVYVSSPRGKIKMKALVTEDIRNNVVNIDHGWWFPEKQAPDFGVWESNANLLTSAAPPYDPALGTYQLRGLLCRIEKAGTRTDY